MTQEELAELKSLAIKCLKEKGLVAFLTLIGLECANQKTQWALYVEFFADAVRKEENENNS